MSVSYKKLQHILIEREISHSQLMRAANISANIISNKKKELEKIKTENDNQEKNLNKIKAKATKFKFKKYDREAASLYARKYAKNPNKDYPFYGKPDYKGDCTNFTSQCLYAGGIVTDNVGKYQWYMIMVFMMCV